MLVVGTRGRSLGGMQGLLPGSVSKYCLQQSPIPVIVVRPSTKRMKKKKKRQEDPNRRNYDQILERSGAKGGIAIERADTPTPGTPAQLPGVAEQEAEAVAEAVGPRKGRTAAEENDALVRVISAKSEDVSAQESPSPRGPLSPEPKSVVMKSPTLGTMDSPSVSGESEGEGDGEEEGESDEIEDGGGGKSRVEERPGNAIEAVVEEVIPERKANEEIVPDQKG